MVGAQQQSESKKEHQKFRHWADASEMKLRFSASLLQRQTAVTNIVPALVQGFICVHNALNFLSETASNVPLQTKLSHSLCSVIPVSEDDIECLQQYYAAYLQTGQAPINRREAKKYVRLLRNAVLPLLDWRKRNVPAPSNRRQQYAVRWFLPMVCLFVGLACAGGIIAAEMPPQEQGLRATYFADKNFKKLVAARIDEQIDFKWSKHSPHPAVPPDNFSARWEGTVIIRGDEQRIFSVGADDGAQLFIDDKLVINNSGPHAFIAQKSKHPIGRGEHRIRLEFVEFNGAARVNLTWSTPNGYWEVVPAYRLRPAEDVTDLQSPNHFTASRR